MVARDVARVRADVDGELAPISEVKDDAFGLVNLAPGLDETILKIRNRFALAFFEITP